MRCAKFIFDQVGNYNILLHLIRSGEYFNPKYDTVFHVTYFVIIIILRGERSNTNLDVAKTKNTINDFVENLFVILRMSLNTEEMILNREHLHLVLVGIS